MSTLKQTTGPLIIRLATEDDGAAVKSLAELDSSRPPAGALLLAELAGQSVAALSIADGEAIADPFVPTGEVLELLRLRAGQLRPRLAPRGRVARRRRMRTPRARSRRSLWR